MTIRNNMEILELHDYTQAQFEDLKQLMSELSNRVNFTQSDLQMVLKDSNCHLYVILESLTPGPSPKGEGRIIGCATLCVFHSPTGTKASIEDVVVSSAYRGQHLGKQLMEDFLEKHTFMDFPDKRVYSDCKVKYINKTKQTEKIYRNVEVWYTYNEIRELCFVIPLLCGRPFRFSQFDLNTCKYKHERRTLYIEGTDWANTGKGDYCIEIWHPNH